MIDQKKQSEASQGGMRQIHTKVRTAKGRKKSSTKWLQRQLNDPYVQMANRDGYRSRAAYKIIEIDNKFKIFSAGKSVMTRSHYGGVDASCCSAYKRRKSSRN